MSEGITFNNLQDANDYKKMKYAVGQVVEVEKVGARHKATITKTHTNQEKMVGGGSYAILEYDKLPPEHIRREMDKYNLVYDIDPEIRNSVISLNKQGYKTAGSCAGHKDPNGFITIKGNLTESQREEVIKILAKDDIKVYKVDSKKYEGLHTEFNFKSIGKYTGKNDKIISRR